MAALKGIEAIGLALGAAAHQGISALAQRLGVGLDAGIGLRHVGLDGADHCLNFFWGLESVHLSITFYRRVVCRKVRCASAPVPVPAPVCYAGTVKGPA